MTGMDWFFVAWLAVVFVVDPALVGAILWVANRPERPAGNEAVPRAGSAGLEGGTDAGPVVARGEGVAPG